MSLHRRIAEGLLIASLLASFALPCPMPRVGSPDPSEDGAASGPIMVAACSCGCHRAPAGASAGGPKQPALMPDATELCPGADPAHWVARDFSAVPQWIRTPEVPPPRLLS